MLFTEDLCFAPPQKCRHVNLSFYESKKKKVSWVAEHKENLEKNNRKILKLSSFWRCRFQSFQKVSTLESPGYRVVAGHTAGHQESQAKAWPWE